MKTFKVNICLLSLLLIVNNLSSQSDELIPVKDCTPFSLNSILGGEANKTEKVRIISENEGFVTIDVAFLGYKTKDYIIAGKILNAQNKPIPEFAEVKKDLPKSGNNIDLRLQFKKKTNSYSSPSIESAFISITIMEKGFMTDIKGLDVSDLGLGDKCIYPFKRQWTVGASENTIVKVSMSPVGRAGSIKQIIQP